MSTAQSSEPMGPVRSFGKEAGLQRCEGLDATLESYPDRNSVFAANYFERKIRGSGVNMTEQVPFQSLGPDPALWQPLQRDQLIANPSTPISVTTRINSPDAYRIKGMEFAYSQAFKFLPEPFDGLGGTVSVTKVDVQGRNKTIQGTNFNMKDLPPQTCALTAYYE